MDYDKLRNMVAQEVPPNQLNRDTATRVIDLVSNRSLPHSNRSAQHINRSVPYSNRKPPRNNQKKVITVFNNIKKYLIYYK